MATLIHTFQYIVMANFVRLKFLKHIYLRHRMFILWTRNCWDSSIQLIKTRYIYPLFLFTHFHHSLSLSLQSIVQVLISEKHYLVWIFHTIAPITRHDFCKWTTMKNITMKLIKHNLLAYKCICIQMIVTNYLYVVYYRSYKKKWKYLWNCEQCKWHWNHRFCWFITSLDLLEIISWLVDW